MKLSNCLCYYVFRTEQTQGKIRVSDRTYNDIKLSRPMQNKLLILPHVLVPEINDTMRW